MKRLTLIGLTLAAFAPSASAEPVKAPVQPQSAPLQDLAAQNDIELPVARHVVDFRTSDAPNIVLAGERVLLDRDEVGSAREVREAQSLKRVDGLFSSLKARRERWKAAHPGVGFPGVAVLWLDRSTPALVTKSLFQTVAFSGYPNLIFAVRREDGTLAALYADARVPLPPGASAAAREPDEFALHVEHRSDGAIFLVWKGGNMVLNQRETSETMSARGFPGLAQIVSEEWQAYGGHRTRHDVRFDQAILHVENTLTFDATAALMDAMSAPDREYQDGEQLSRMRAFNVVFAVN